MRTKRDALFDAAYERHKNRVAACVSAIETHCGGDPELVGELVRLVREYRSVDPMIMERDEHRTRRGQADLDALALLARLSETETKR